ncbi:MAG TPA: ABC transporter permease, partial [Candidatus Dormibacteraeota bacterium]|nr:ABC transporter permease [Candidatus Dormibacteraeota bacterium]
IAHLFSGDVILVSPATAPDVVATQVAKDEGVTVSRLRFLSAPVDGELLGVTAIDVGPYRDRGGIDVVDGDRAAALADIDSGLAVIAPRSLADAAGWHTGSMLHLGSAANGDQPVELRVDAIAAHTFPAGDGRESLVIGRSAAQRLFGAQAQGFDDLDVSAGGATGAVEAAAARYGLQAQTIDDLRAAARRALGHTLDTLSALSWVAVTAAMLAVATTLAVNVRQGRRELALLRAVGMGRREALRLLVAEAVLLGLTGTVLGVAAGLLLDPLLVRAASSATFDPQLAVPWATVAAAAIAVVGGSAVAVLAPARAAVRASVARELRHE